MSDVNCCFDYYHAWYFTDVVEDKLKIIKEHYHDSIYFIIKEMLKVKENERPNLAQVISKI